MIVSHRIKFENIHFFQYFMFIYIHAKHLHKYTSFVRCERGTEVVPRFHYAGPVVAQHGRAAPLAPLARESGSVVEAAAHGRGDRLHGGRDRIGRVGPCRSSNTVPSRPACACVAVDVPCKHHLSSTHASS